MKTETNIDLDLEPGTQVGSEDFEVDTSESSEQTDVTTGETEATVTADETGYTKEKQQLDFEKANARRAREELAAMTEAHEQATSELKQLRQEIANLQGAKDREENKLEDMDSDLVDEIVSKNIRTLEKRLAAKEKQFDEMAQKVAFYEQKIQQDEQQRKNDKAKESILATVEKQLGKFGVAGAAKYRNEANKLADELVDSGEKDQPKTFAQAIDLLTDCYLQIKSKKEKGSNKTVSVDTGKGGAKTTEKKSGIKSGTLDNVADQMLRDRSWLG